MKTLIAAILISLSPVAFADDCNTVKSEAVAQEKLVISTDVPAHLKGATIIVRQADGRESQVSAEAFKVVPRKQQYIVTKTLQSSKTMCVDNRNFKNRVTVLGGEGPNKDVDVTRNANSVTMENESGAVGALQYQRSLNDRLNLGVQIQTNESALIGVGLDF